MHPAVNKIQRKAKKKYDTYARHYRGHIVRNEYSGYKCNCPYSQRSFSHGGNTDRW